jgi:anti-sigma regulatory factor (Ser/Thr protein kinase)
VNCLCLDLRSASEGLETIWVFVEENALGAGLDEEEVKRIELAVEEATVNIIRHAYGGEGGKLELCCTPVPGGLEFCLADEGPPFNPLDAPTPEAVTDVASLKIGGLGIHLMRHMADALSYRRDGGRNVLTLGFLRRSGDDR